MRPICLVPVFLALSTGMAIAAPGDTHNVVTVATLRAAPGGPEIGTASARDPAPLVERSRQGGWIETDRGWIWGPLTCPTGAARAAGPDQAAGGDARPDDAGAVACVPSSASVAGMPVPATNPNRMQIGVYASDLRKAPKADAPADFRLSRGTEVMISRTDGDWVRISLGDATGWVLRSHLQPVDATAAANAAPPAVAKPAPARRGVESGVTLAGY